MRSALIILAVLAVSVYSQGINGPECGTSPVRIVRDAQGNDKVVGGQASKLGDWPWQGELQRSGSLTCGGSIIASTCFLTAAHCITTTAATCATYLVRLGLLTRNQPDTGFVTRTIAAGGCINHPAYNSGNFRNDASVLKFSSAVGYTSNIVPACLAANLHDHATEITSTHVSGTTCTGLNCPCNLVSYATGWGTMSAGGLANIMQVVDLCITTHADCAAFYGTTTFSPEHMICAGTRGDGKDTCQGDSGGPLVIRDQNAPGKFIHVGITSWGRGCGDIGVYAKTASVRNWIDQTCGAI